jgi:putative flavoprotein involved in K+ transport
MSEHLTRAGISHVVLERGRIAENWRSARWDSLVANGPCWHDRFPGLAFAGNQDRFVPKEEVADYFVEYAGLCGAPEQRFEANYIVAATGAFQLPVIPPLVPEQENLTQIHSASYRNPGQLPEGAVMVVGAGSSGVQIAEELLRAGRKVYLSVGPHDRPPRRYRGRDNVWWLGVLNKWDMEATPEAEHTTIAVTGAGGGFTIDFRTLAAQGLNLVGRTEAFSDGKLQFSADLAANIERGDANYLSVLDEADAYVAANNLDLPEEPEARVIAAAPECMTTPLLSLDLHQAGITTIIWATGFVSDYSWIKVDGFDAQGLPIHKRGISVVPGIYFLGLPWQSRRGSSFIWGVYQDAKYVADHIAKQYNYLAYRPDTARVRE